MRHASAVEGVLRTENGEQLNIGSTPVTVNVTVDNGANKLFVL
jgi:hypothetical protein